MSMLKSRRDTEIKLFGKTITSLLAMNHYDQSSLLSPLHGVSNQTKEASSSSSSSCSPSSGPNMVLANNHEQDNTRFKPPCILYDLNEPPRATSEVSSPRSSKTNGDQQSEITTTTTSTSEDKPTTTLKKPDEILPCPRCQSANTKFCYYNNYNVSQPRYFCRNCQRYWTAGGSMRNVAVGSGRRKNKGWASSSHYLQVTSQDYNDNSGTILSFGSSESSVTETGEHQENKIHQGFLAPQVMLPNNSSPWPYQWSPNTSFYPIPFYWGCTVPIWPTSETSPCLGKRSRNQIEVETKDSTVCPKLPTKPEKKTEGFSLFDGFETKCSNRRSLVPETSINLQANPAAMCRSMNFRESMQQ